MNKPLVEFNNITKKFPRVIANKNVSFNINKSTVHALLGENGAGTRILLSCVSIIGNIFCMYAFQFGSSNNFFLLIARSSSDL